MIVTTTDTVPGREIVQTIDIAQGNTVQARNAGRDITQGLRNITGGELKGYTTLFTDAREEALIRLEEDAESIGADAVVNVRFTSSQIAAGGAEILAYGTAVVLD